LKHCLQHIIRSSRSATETAKSSYDSAWQECSAGTFSANRRFDSSIIPAQQNEYKQFCIHRLLPQWVFGDTDDEEHDLLRLSFTANERSPCIVPVGWPARLYGLHDANAVEGENHAALASGARGLKPFGAALVYFRRISDTY
jgi:hypothetical protein